MDESCVDLYALEPQYHCRHGSVSYEPQSHLGRDLHSRGNSNVDHEPGGFAARTIHSRDGSDTTAVQAFMIATRVSTIGPKSTRALLMAEICHVLSKAQLDSKRKARGAKKETIDDVVGDVVCQCPYMATASSTTSSVMPVDGIKQLRQITPITLPLRGFGPRRRNNVILRVIET